MKNLALGLTLICTLFSFTLHATDQDKYLALKQQVEKANKAQAKALIPRIRAMYNLIAKARAQTQSELDQNIKLYEETFSLMERMNPFDAESSDCKDKKIEPREKKLKALKKLAKNLGKLLDDSKIKAGIMGDFHKCSTSTCQALVTGDVSKCESGDCKAFVTGNVKFCTGDDCKAFLTGDIKNCYSSDCKAYLSGNIKKCSSGDCEAFMSNNPKKCYTSDCNAYFTRNTKDCGSSDCEVYLNFGKVSQILKIKTCRETYVKGSVPIMAIYRYQQEKNDDDDDTLQSLSNMNTQMNSMTPP